MSHLVSVVVLSYSRPALLRQALESVRQQSYRNVEIVVVDNPSPASGEIVSLVKSFPDVQLIQLDSNLGYTGGMNKGLARVAGDYILLTEDDIVLGDECIQTLVDYMTLESSADLVAPIIYNKESGTIRCAGGETVLGGVFRRTIHGWDEPDCGQFTKSFDVTYIDGATMFASRSFWQRFKGFREEFFMYVDSAELCARVAETNGRMTILPQAKVYHFEPPTVATPSDLEFHKVKNFFSLYLLHAPARILPEFICRYAILNGIRTLFGRTGSSPRAFFKALFWVARYTPSLMRERYAGRGYST